MVLGINDEIHCIYCGGKMMYFENGNMEIGMTGYFRCPNCYATTPSGKVNNDEIHGFIKRRCLEQIGAYFSSCKEASE